MTVEPKVEPESRGVLDVSGVLDGARLVVLGGTGFLGKIFWAMLLDRYPNVGRIFLVVRPKGRRTPDERFWAETAASEVFEPLRRTHGEGFEAFLREKVVPIDGDMGRPLCGLDEALVRELKGTVDAVINVAGVVDFNPPLDEALHANAFGAQNLVGLGRALGNTPVYHTSTCYVAGSRKGPILEDDPRLNPFPRAEELGAHLWDPEREIAECLDLVAQAKQRCEDAFRQSEFAEAARRTLLARGEPVTGDAYEREVARVKRKYVSQRLVEAGLDRATHWGWPNIYTYTKSIGEQVIAASGLPFTITRPACCESCVDFPVRSFNEGVTTSSPLLYLMMKGQVHVLAKHVPLDLIPTDHVVAAMILALAELLEGSAKPVYQMGASDVNPCTAQRFGEMVGLYKRKYYRRKGTGNLVFDAIQARVEPSFVDAARFDMMGPPVVATAAREVASLLRKTAPALVPAARALEGVAARESKIAEILRLFEPFSSRQNGPFDCSNTRAAFARAAAPDKEKLRWAPESIDWADWMMNIHMPAIEKRIIPEMDKRLNKEPKPLAAHATLVSLVAEMAERHGEALALQAMTDEGLTRVTFADVRRRATAAAARLAAIGVKKGDRVALAGTNDPDWAIAYFGIVHSGAVAVPIDPALDAVGWAGVLSEAAVRAVVWDEGVRARGAALAGRDDVPWFDLNGLAQEAHDGDALPGPLVDVAPDDVASIIFTSGTTGRPKGVMLTHANFTSLVAALASVFPLSKGDAVLSVLPLHHTFEFTCGLLLPLSRGARVVYVGEVSGDRIAEGLRASRATAMVGVPALWQVLERRILSEVDTRGPLARAAFDVAGEVNRWLSSNVGVDAGRLLFGPVHDNLGGQIRWLISGGAALPRATIERFRGLGLPLAQGYGLTEAAPVLTVSRPGNRIDLGVGKPIPGVDLRIDNPDERGVGEVVARGPNVMVGYTDGDATRDVIDAEGWLHTGDLGRVDKKGRLEIVGRIKDVVISPTGENVYPDDVEKRLGRVPHIAELAIVGVQIRGSERLGCLAVAEGEGDRATRNDRARTSLRAAIDELPASLRPSIVHLFEAPLPRTATRKVVRGEVRAILSRLAAATGAVGEAGVDGSLVRTVIATAAGVGLEVVHAHATLDGDLGYDSLMRTELLEALETRFGAVDPQRLQACMTVAEVEELVRTKAGVRAAPMLESGAAETAPVVLPESVQQAGKAIIGRLQDLFYGEVMKPRVVGRGHVPHNRNVIVVANHGSHLDMGLVRHALGEYGEDLVSLAAQDYFFGSGVRRAFFENLTHLVPIDRKASLRQAIRQAGDVIARGKTVLIFPEGTRSPAGEIQEFKPLVGHLALAHGVDVLPIFLGGTHAAMPKGALVPTHRDLLARIGPPLCVGDLRRVTAQMSPADAAREVARLAREAVLALRDGAVLDLAAGAPAAGERANPLVELFAELQTKFRAGEVERPVSYYVSLGNDDLAKWTVRVDSTGCDVRPGKPDGQADCVLKTSPEIFTKIVRESYVPSPADFVSGLVKSNDVALLMTFQKVFQLDQAS
jgi:long-chain acyl-CoA synthetase